MTEEFINSDSGEKESEIDFSDLVSALLDEDSPLPPRYLFKFSDLDGKELDELKGIWSNLSIDRKRNFLRDFEELTESNNLLSFENVCQIGLFDPDSEIRKLSIRALWESEDPVFIPIFLDILENDESIFTSAQAASGLGHYVYLGELDKISQERLHEITSLLIKVIQSDVVDEYIQQRALESIGYSSEPKTPGLIETAYYKADEDWLASALIAMGRSADEEWEPLVIDKIDHLSPLIRLEAVRATGKLEIAEATSVLLNHLDDEDEDVRTAAIWALSEIGGGEIPEALDRLLENTADEAEIDLIEQAIENLSFNGDLQDLDLYNISNQESEDISYDDIQEGDE